MMTEIPEPKKEPLPFLLQHGEEIDLNEVKESGSTRLTKVEVETTDDD